ncbi:MAG: hypothetical protein RL653_3915 [Pseudomonadota bacterium]|jgi:hypothetical protein
MIRVRLLAVFAVIASGCATHLSSLQTARPVKRGKVQVTAGTGVYANVGPISGLLSEASEEAEQIQKALSSGQPYTLTPEAQKRLLVAGVALAALSPGVGTELSVRTGVLPEDGDAGLRVTGNSVRLDGRYRLANAAQEGALWLDRRSFNVSVGLGVTRYFFSNPLFTALKLVAVDGFTRWDVEVPLYVSVEYGQVLKLYATPRYLFSRTALDAQVVELAREAASAMGLPSGLPAVVDMHFGGATGGVAVGYGPLHLFLEITAGYTFCAPELFGNRTQLGGATFYPAVGLTFLTP